MLSPQQIKARFPNASRSTLRRNAVHPDLTIEQHSQKIEKALEAVTLLPTTDIAKLNKTERAYYLYLRGYNYQWIGVQNITFKLADDTRFTPDFSVIDDGEMRCIDVKGFQREDALIKIKVAARMFPWASFVIVKKDKGGWSHREVKP